MYVVACCAEHRSKAGNHVGQRNRPIDNGGGDADGETAIQSVIP
jgi:hypothetical protein